jgi:hypothetical protein
MPDDIFVPNDGVIMMSDEILRKGFGGSAGNQRN